MNHKLSVHLIKENVVAWGKANGWKQDRWGHLKKTTIQETKRLKFGVRNVRLELKTSAGWVRVASCAWKQLSIVDGKLKIG